jgi:hypothetical protein
VFARECFAPQGLEGLERLGQSNLLMLGHLPIAFSYSEPNQKKYKK